MKENARRFLCAGDGALVHDGCRVFLPTSRLVGEINLPAIHTHSRVHTAHDGQPLPAAAAAAASMSGRRLAVVAGDRLGEYSNFVLRGLPVRPALPPRLTAACCRRSLAAARLLPLDAMLSCVESLRWTVVAAATSPAAAFDAAAAASRGAA